MSSPIHLTRNPTDKYLVIADNYYSMHDTGAEARAAYEAACPGDIGDSVWGSIRIMPPQHEDAYAEFVPSEDRKPMRDITIGRTLIPSLAEKAKEIQTEIAARIAMAPKEEIDFGDLFAE